MPLYNKIRGGTVPRIHCRIRKTNRMKDKLPRILAAFTALLLFLPPFATLGAETALKKGDKGREVANLMLRLFDLGYLPSVKGAGDVYTARLAGYVRAFQGNNHLPETVRSTTSIRTKRPPSIRKTFPRRTNRASCPPASHPASTRTGTPATGATCRTGSAWKSRAFIRRKARSSGLRPT